MSEFDIPVDPEKRRKLKAMIVEMTNCHQRIDSEREQLKSIAELAEDEFSIKKKFINKVARTMYKHNYDDLQAENTHFEELYETIAEGRVTNTTD